MKPCAVEGCNASAVTRSLCPKHYHRLRKHGNPLAGRVEPGVPKRFIHEEVLKCASDDCLIWPYARSSSGYGAVNWGGRTVIASRLVCELAHGAPSAKGMEAAHLCGKGHLGCVNPRHLVWKTHVENLADQENHGTRMWGAKNHASKLTPAQAQEIRLASGASLRDLADAFGVSKQAVSNIRRGHSWKNTGDVGVAAE